MSWSLQASHVYTFVKHRATLSRPRRSLYLIRNTQGTATSLSRGTWEEQQQQKKNNARGTRCGSENFCFPFEPSFRSSNEKSFCPRSTPRMPPREREREAGTKGLGGGERALREKNNVNASCRREPCRVAAPHCLSMRADPPPHKSFRW